MHNRSCSDTCELGQRSEFCPYRNTNLLHTLHTPFISFEAQETFAISVNRDTFNQVSHTHTHTHGRPQPLLILDVTCRCRLRKNRLPMYTQPLCPDYSDVQVYYFWGASEPSTLDSLSSFPNSSFFGEKEAPASLAQWAFTDKLYW